MRVLKDVLDDIVGLLLAGAIRPVEVIGPASEPLRVGRRPMAIEPVIFKRTAFGCLNNHKSIFVSRDSRPLDWNPRVICGYVEA